MDVGVPAPLDHVPLGFVAVHREAHASTPRRDPVVATALAVDRLEEFFEGADVVEGARLGHVAPVEQDVDPDPGDLLLVAARDHREQVLDVAVDIAVGEQAEEVERLARVAHVLGQLLPGAPALAIEDRTAVDRLLDELGSLIEDASGAERVVADLAVAHVGVVGHPDRLAMGAQLGRGRVRSEPVEVRRARQPDRVGFVLASAADAIHDADDHRPGHAGAGRVLPESERVAHRAGA